MANIISWIFLAEKSQYFRTELIQITVEDVQELKYFFDTILTNTYFEKK